ncbi:MAG: hypothetical protein IPM39_14210 [Chloroflexi bacterium]|nr:hypothetical protein [Chloroflexota bacterium]
MMLAGAVGYLLADATGYRFRQYGAFWWATAVFVTFLLGMLYYAIFVLPIPGSEGWAEGLRLLWRNYLTPPRRPAANTAQARRTAKTAVPPHLAHLPPSFVTLRSGIGRSHQAFALVKGSSYARPAGPGFVVLYKGESVSQVIDLRRHTRSQRVKANTRDGIPVELDVFVLFRIWQQEPDLSPDNLVYPYDSDALFQVSYASSVDPTDTLRRWSSQVVPRAAAMLVMEIAQYALDEFYQVDANGFGPLNEIRQRVQRNLEQNDGLAGIEILNVGTSKLILPPEVAGQRIKQWQVRWQRDISIKRAAGDAEVERRLKQARARAQIEIIDNITQSILSMRRSDDVNLTEVITLRMIEAFEEAVADVSTQALIPQPVLTSIVDSSREMLTWMEAQEESP